MSRAATIYPQDVLDCIKNSDSITVRAIASQIGCSVSTVQNKLKILRRDGEPIYFTSEGYKYREAITEVDEAIEIKKFQRTLLGSFKTIQLFARNNKKAISQSMKILRYDMTPKERKTLRAATAKMLTLIDIAEAGMEFGDE